MWNNLWKVKKECNWKVCVCVCFFFVFFFFQSSDRMQNYKSLTTFFWIPLFTLLVFCISCNCCFMWLIQIIYLNQTSDAQHVAVDCDLRHTACENRHRLKAPLGDTRGVAILSLSLMTQFNQIWYCLYRVLFRISVMEKLFFYRIFCNRSIVIKCLCSGRKTSPILRNGVGIV